MSEKLISIIIPVYNSQSFLARAVDSCLAQSGSDFEVVLVNDGSTDSSGKLCDDYAAAHSNFRVVHKVNGGLSSARNAGIAAAEGEYLVFLDSDDYLAADTCALLAEIIRSHKPDFIDFGWNYINTQGEITPNLHKLPKNTLLGKDVLFSTVLPPLLNLRKDPDHFIFDYSCTKVFRKDIITAHDIRFDESRRIWEDRPFVVNYLRYCENMYSMDRCLYYYIFTEGSLSARYNADCLRIIPDNFLLYRSLFGKEYDFDIPYANNYWAQSMENMILRSLEQQENRDQIHQLMLAALRREPVIHWFAHRTDSDAKKQQIDQLIVAGRCEEALALYAKLAKHNKRKQASARLIENLKRPIRKVIRLFR